MAKGSLIKIQASHGLAHEMFEFSFRPISFKSHEDLQLFKKDQAPCILMVLETKRLGDLNSAV
jgi:hypothetical protein